MAISGTTVAQPGAFGCQSPAETETLYVTRFNASSSAMNATSTNAVLHSTQSIRCSDDGEIHTFDSILLGSVVTNVTGKDFTGSLAVKRPTCTCTAMHKFHGQAKFGAAINMRRITFEDGYSVDCGEKLCFISINGDGIIAKTADSLAAGDQIIKCGYPGAGEQPIASDCTRVITNTAISTTGRFIGSVSTHWPQAAFPSSEVRGCLMLENGVYVMWIPNGGSY